MPTQGEPNLAPEHNTRRLSRHHALVIIGQCNLLVCPASNAPPQLPPSGLDDRLTGPQSGDEPETIAGMLASKEDDPSTKAARQLDWAELVQELGHVAKEILKALANGHELTRLVRRLRRSRSSLQNDKMELAKLIRERLGKTF